ncbi:porin [Thauera mechernichensis]
MQKKLIALAVAGLVSAPAFAQSNVTIYGVVDMGYQYTSGSDTKSLKSRSGVDSGLQSGSRIGFRGTEDLGNGLKAGFVLENSISPDVSSNVSLARQSFLSLSGGFGTVAVGRQYSPQYNLVSAIDPFGAGTVGDVTYGRGVYFQGASVAPDSIRLDNLVAYVSPSFGGLTVTAGYTADAIGDEPLVARGAQSSAAEIWAVSPVYKNGPLMVGLNYHQVKIDSLDHKDKVWDLGGTYDFGVVKVAALYGQFDTDEGSESGKVKQWMLGLSAPVGAAGRAMFSYSSFEGSWTGEPDAEADKWAIGYTHSLSKRTNLYAAYADIDTNQEARGAFSVKRGALRGGQFDDFTKGLNIGVRHTF